MLTDKEGKQDAKKADEDELELHILRPYPWQQETLYANQDPDATTFAKPCQVQNRYRGNQAVATETWRATTRLTNACQCIIIRYEHVDRANFPYYQTRSRPLQGSARVS